MTTRRPLIQAGGDLQELPKGDKSAGSWAKALAVPSGGAVSQTIPSGVFNALPVIAHAIQAAGSRDYVFRLTTLTLNADKSVTLAGVVRESRQMPAIIATLGALAGFDTFQAATTAVTLHLFAEESD